jgi:hypothetical protein
MTPEQVAVVTATPAWVHAATAIAVLGGVVASILLLMRNKLAVPLFAISLAAAVVQDIYIFFMSDSLAAFGKQPIIIQGLVLIIGAFMFRYSRSKRVQGLLLYAPFGGGARRWGTPQKRGGGPPPTWSRRERA